jgi:hypothetical protein
MQLSEALKEQVYNLLQILPGRPEDVPAYESSREYFKILAAGIAHTNYLLAIIACQLEEQAAKPPPPPPLRRRK